MGWSGAQRLTANGHDITFWRIENVLKLDCSDCLSVLKPTVPLKQVNCMVHKFYLNKLLSPQRFSFL